MTTTKIISELNKNGISFKVENKYNDYNKEIYFSFNGIEFEADITTGKTLGFINENGRVYKNLKSILN
jgi:hypothetical protein